MLRLAGCNCCRVDHGDVSMNVTDCLCVAGQVMEMLG